MTIQSKNMRRCLVIVTTVPETFRSILNTQPRFLGEFFRVVLVTSDKKACKELAIEEGVEVHCIDMVRGISPLRDCISIIKLFFLLLQLRASVVHSYTPKAGLVAMIASWLCFVPIRIHTFTGLIFPSRTGFMRKLLISMDRLVSLLSTHIVPEGKGVRNDLVQFGVCKRPCPVIGNGNIAGVDTDYFSKSSPGVQDDCHNLRATYNIKPSNFVFCFVGRLNRDKGLQELAAAMKGLSDPDIRLLILGLVDRTAPVEEAVMKSLQNDSRITFCGYQKDIRPFLSLADAIVLPSYREGFPNVLLQASSMELPMIATDVNGCNEIVEEGVNGWLVPSKNSEALRNAMLAAFQTNRHVLRQMGCTARSSVLEKFDRNYYTSQLLAFYQGRFAELKK